MGQAVSKTLQGVGHLPSRAITPEKPTLRLKSPPEKPLRRAVERLAGQRQEEQLESDPRRAVAKRLEAPLERVKERLDSMEALAEPVT